MRFFLGRGDLLWFFFLCLGFFLSIALVEAKGTRPSIPAEQVLFPPRPILLDRPGKDYCWTRWRGTDEFPTFFCLSQELSRKILWERSNTAWDEEKKLTLIGKKKLRASLSGLVDAAPKKYFYNFYLKNLRIEKTKPKNPSLGFKLNKILEKMATAIEQKRERLSSWLDFKSGLGVCRRLVIGQSLGREQESFLRLQGFVHLTTVAGIHLWALAGLIFVVVRTVGRRLRLSVSLSLRGAQFAMAGVWLWGWLLAGAPNGMLRPLFAIALRSAALRLGWRWRFWVPVTLATVAEFIWVECLVPHRWPTWESFLANPGRSHYFLAVIGGLIGLEWAKKWGRPKWREHVGMSVGSWMTIALLDLAKSHATSILTPVLSLITIPIFTLIVYPVGLWLSFIEEPGWYSDFILEFLAWIERVLVSISDWMQELPYLWFIDGYFFVLSGLAALVFVIWKVRWSSFLLLASTLLTLRLFFSSLLATPAGVLSQNISAIRVEQLDVGQGDAAWILERDRDKGVTQAGMIDTGSEKAAIATDWIQALAYRKVAHLDWVAFTHWDEDHAGGLRQLIRAVPIRALVASISLWNSSKGKDVQALAFEYGIPCYSVESLMQNSKNLSLDWSSSLRGVVLNHPKAKVQNSLMTGYGIPLEGGGTYLNLGDSGVVQERQFLKWRQRIIHEGRSVAEGFRANPPMILKLSHHGSKTSSASELLTELNPNLVWISLGFHNQYHHPHVQVLDRLAHFGIQAHRTDLEGTLRWERSDSGRLGLW